MGKIIITIFLLISVFPVLAEDDLNAAKQQAQEQEEAGKWVNDWWENVVEVQSKEEIDEETIEAVCPKKLERYKRKVEEDPKSEYYKYKLESWTERCTKPVDQPTE